MLNRASSVWSHVRVLEVDSEGTATADVVVLDDRERIVAELRGLRVRANEPRRNQAVAAEVPAASGTAISLEGEFRLEELIREIGHDRVHFHHTDVRGPCLGGGADARHPRALGAAGRAGSATRA